MSVRLSPSLMERPMHAAREKILQTSVFGSRFWPLADEERGKIKAFWLQPYQRTGCHAQN